MLLGRLGLTIGLGLVFRVRVRVRLRLRFGVRLLFNNRPTLFLIHSKLDWINFGTVKILYMILEHSCREPEVIVKCCVRNLSKVISRCGHRGFGLRS